MIGKPVEFRVWDIDNKQMVHSKNGRILADISPKHVRMQNVGTDSLGDTMFEGDIIQVSFETSRKLFCIQWDEDACSFILDNCGMQMGFKDIAHHCKRIVGNVFENPHMIEGESLNYETNEYVEGWCSHCGRCVGVPLAKVFTENECDSYHGSLLTYLGKCPDCGSLIDVSESISRDCMCRRDKT